MNDTLRAAPQRGVIFSRGRWRLQHVYRTLPHVRLRQAQHYHTTFCIGLSVDSYFDPPHLLHFHTLALRLHRCWWFGTPLCLLC